MRGMARTDLGRRIMDLEVAGKARLLVSVLRDDRVPPAAKAVLPAVILYLVSPRKLIPSAIPVLGRVDDLLVVAVGITLFVALTPDRVLEEYLKELE